MDRPTACTIYHLLFTIYLFVLPAQAAPPDGMALIPAGSYRPLFATVGPTNVAAFYLDVYPVTNEQFLEFVRANPAWRRSNVKRIFTDASYLEAWAGDLDLGANASRIAHSPVTYVSWFAAKAYADGNGKRLPTLAEWERAAAASETNDYGYDDPAFNRRLLAWYTGPVPDVLPPVGSTFRNIYGVWDLHGLVWEWVADFNSALVTGESRGDTGLERQRFCAAGSVGASSFTDYPAFMRFALRSSLKANYTVANLGFRCAKDVENNE